MAIWQIKLFVFFVGKNVFLMEITLIYVLYFMDVETEPFDK